MHSNVPADWNIYQRKCFLCGKRYHLSEGWCSCIDNLDSCGCRANDWELKEGQVVCSRCGTKPGEDLEEES